MQIHTPNRAGTLVTGALLTSMAALPAAVVVDHFGSPFGGQGVSISNGIVGTSQDDVRTGLAGVLGGSREIFLQLQAIYDPANFSSANVNGPTSTDQFALANGPNVDSLLRLIWDANGGGLNTNLSSDYQFSLLQAFNDIPVAYTITMQTFGGGSSTQTVSAGANFNGNVVFPFSGFTGGANLADIDRISLAIEGARSVDVRFDALATVPEPATAGLVLLGGLGLLVRRRRA